MRKGMESASLGGWHRVGTQYMLESNIVAPRL